MLCSKGSVADFRRNGQLLQVQVAGRAQHGVYEYCAHDVALMRAERLEHSGYHLMMIRTWEPYLILPGYVVDAMIRSEWSDVQNTIYPLYMQIIGRIPQYDRVVQMQQYLGQRNAAEQYPSAGTSQRIHIPVISSADISHVSTCVPCRMYYLLPLVQIVQYPSQDTPCIHPCSLLLVVAVLILCYPLSYHAPVLRYLLLCMYRC